ncbi:MAG: HNH endonuclease [Thiobacillus sp.]
MSEIMKPCKKCGATDRYANGNCKPCMRANSSAWSAANPDKVRAGKAAYRIANAEKLRAEKAAYRASNKEKLRAYRLAYYSANTDKLRAYRLAYYSANTDKLRAYQESYRDANPEKCRARFAAWRAANTEKARASNAVWRTENPDKIRVNNHNYRAMKRENGGKLSQGVAARLFKLQRGKCACGCKKPLGDNYHLDHIIPIALGGSNTDENIQLLRAKCNIQKKAKHPIEFMQSKGYLL